MRQITVVITTYNLAGKIELCFADLMAQTFHDFDVLVVDDCSTDSTVPVIRQCSGQFEDQIQLVQLHENLGSPARTRNVAMDSGLIQGKYVVFLDGDDRLEPDFLEQLYRSAEETESEITFCSYDRIEEETGHVLCVEMQNFPKEILFPPQDDILAFINGALWNKLIRTSLIGNSRIPDFKVGEDLSFALALYCKCKKLSSVNKVLIHYCVRANSVISNTQLSTIHQFAAEFVKNKDIADNKILKDTVALTAFINIGISMAIRAYDNKNIDISEHLKWTHRYFQQNFNMFFDVNFLKFHSLQKRGLKGITIWACKILYRIGCFKIFLVLYRMIIRLFHFDIKY